MPSTLTGAVASFSNTLNVPINGEFASDSSISTPFQTILNDAKYLFDIVKTGGVESIRNVADTTALKALTGMVNGAAAVVRGKGLYVYVDPDSTVEALPFVVAPNTGTGRWNAASVAYTPNRIVTTGVVTLSNSNQAVAQDLVNLVDLTGASFTLTGAQAGDKVALDAFVNVAAIGASPALLAITVVEGATPYVAVSNTSNVASQSTSQTTLYTVIATSTLTVKLQARSNSTGSTISGGTLRALLIRP